MQHSPGCRRVRRLFSFFLSAFRWVRTNGRTHVLVRWERERKRTWLGVSRVFDKEGKGKEKRKRRRQEPVWGMLGFSRETDITHGAACLGTEIVTGVELSGVPCARVACARSPCNGCMPRGYFQVPVWNTADKIRVFRERYRENDPPAAAAAALDVIISQVLIRARNENSVKIKWQNVRWAI